MALPKTSDERLDAAATAPPRDLLEIAGDVGELALTLKWAGKGLADGWENGGPVQHDRLAALRALRRARADLDGVIAELDALRIGEG